MSKVEMHSQTKSDTRRNYDIVDITKFILSLMVVCLHVPCGFDWMKPILRIAVPLFFMISSFFFFSKVRKISDVHSQLECLKHFVVRNLQLYLFYLLLFFPITLHRRKWLESGILHGIVSFLQDFLFGSTFVASWYIMASIIGMIIVFYLSRKLSNKFMLIFASVMYLFCCLFSNYYHFSEQLMGGFMENFEKVLLVPYNNVFVSFFWIVCGKIFADRSTRPKRSMMIYILVLSVLLLLVESRLTEKLCRTDDCYIMLIPVCIAIFTLIIQEYNVIFKNGQLLRKLSTLIYASHGSFIPVCSLVLNKTPFGNVSWILFIVTLLACLVYSFIVMKLEKKKYFSWLHYAY